MQTALLTRKMYLSNRNKILNRIRCSLKYLSAALLGRGIVVEQIHIVILLLRWAQKNSECTLTKTKRETGMWSSKIKATAVIMPRDGGHPTPQALVEELEPMPGPTTRRGIPSWGESHYECWWNARLPCVHRGAAEWDPASLSSSVCSAFRDMLLGMGMLLPFWSNLLDCWDLLICIC